MSSSIFKTGKSSAFTIRSRRMYQMLSLGAGLLATVYSLFITYYFDQNLSIQLFSWCLTVLYLFSFLLSFINISNVKLYQIIFGVFIVTSIFLIYVAYRLSFSSEYVILMLSIFSVMLVAIPNSKQLLIYFVLIFIPLEVALFLCNTSVGFTLLTSISIGAVFIISYVISKQKSELNYRSFQNAKILKTLVNNTHDSIFLVDYETNEIQDANDNTKEIFGLQDTDDYLNKNFHHLFKDMEFINTHKAKIDLKIKDEGYYQSDAMFRRKDGTSFLGQLHLSPFEALNRKYYLLQIKNIALRKH